MKRRRKVLALLLALVMLAVLGYGFYTVPKHPSVQAYIPGQGNIQGSVDTDYFAAISPDFSIGATVEGVAVFQDPARAWSTFRNLYAVPIKKIQTANHLPPLTRLTYTLYETYGWQTDGIDCEFVTAFLDIYENSF